MSNQLWTRYLSTSKRVERGLSTTIILAPSSRDPQIMTVDGLDWGHMKKRGLLCERCPLPPILESHLCTKWLYSLNALDLSRLCQGDEIMGSFTPKLLGHGSWTTTMPRFLDETIEKSMDCKPKVFWRAQALSVNLNPRCQFRHAYLQDPSRKTHDNPNQHNPFVMWNSV